MPFQRATGMIASSPARSAACAIATDSSHSTLIVLGMSVIDAPPLTLTANTPSLSRFSLDTSGLVARPVSVAGRSLIRVPLDVASGVPSERKPCRSSMVAICTPTRWLRHSAVRS